MKWARHFQIIIIIYYHFYLLIMLLSYLLLPDGLTLYSIYLHQMAPKELYMNAKRGSAQCLFLQRLRRDYLLLCFGTISNFFSVALYFCKMQGKLFKLIFRSFVCFDDICSVYQRQGFVMALLTSLCQPRQLVNELLILLAKLTTQLSKYLFPKKTMIYGCSVVALSRFRYHCCCSCFFGLFPFKYYNFNL